MAESSGPPQPPRTVSKSLEKIPVVGKTLGTVAKFAENLYNLDAQKQWVKHQENLEEMADIEARAEEEALAKAGRQEFQEASNQGQIFAKAGGEIPSNNIMSMYLENRQAKLDAGGPVVPGQEILGENREVPGAAGNVVNDNANVANVSTTSEDDEIDDVLAANNERVQAENNQISGGNMGGGRRTLNNVWDMALQTGTDLAVQGMNKLSNPKKMIKGAKGGTIAGPGSGTSDDIPANLPPGSFVVPAENNEIAKMLRTNYLAPGGKTADVDGSANPDQMVSNGEHVFTPDEASKLTALGINLDELAPDSEFKYNDGGSQLAVEGGFLKKFGDFFRQKNPTGWTNRDYNKINRYEFNPRGDVLAEDQQAPSIEDWYHDTSGRYEGDGIYDEGENWGKGLDEGLQYNIDEYEAYIKENYPETHEAYHKAYDKPERPKKRDYKDNEEYGEYDDQWKDEFMWAMEDYRDNMEKYKTGSSELENYRETVLNAYPDDDGTHDDAGDDGNDLNFLQRLFKGKNKQGEEGDVEGGEGGEGDGGPGDRFDSALDANNKAYNALTIADTLMNAGLFAYNTNLGYTPFESEKPMPKTYIPSFYGAKNKIDQMLGTANSFQKHMMTSDLSSNMSILNSMNVNKLQNARTMYGDVLDKIDTFKQSAVQEENKFRTANADRDFKTRFLNKQLEEQFNKDKGSALSKSLDNIKKGWEENIKNKQKNEASRLAIDTVKNTLKLGKAGQEYQKLIDMLGEHFPPEWIGEDGMTKFMENFGTMEQMDRIKELKKAMEEAANPDNIEVDPTEININENIEQNEEIIE
jgi:hypothetical protein